MNGTVRRRCNAGARAYGAAPPFQQTGVFGGTAPWGDPLTTSERPSGQSRRWCQGGAGGDPGFDEVARLERGVPVFAVGAGSPAGVRSLLFPALARGLPRGRGFSKSFGVAMKVAGVVLTLWCGVLAATNSAASVIVPEAVAPAEVEDVSLYSFDGFCEEASAWSRGASVLGGDFRGLRGTTVQDPLGDLASFDRISLVYPFTRDRGLILLGALFLLVALIASIWDVQTRRSLDD